MQAHLWAVPSNTKILGMQQYNLLPAISNPQTPGLFASYDAKVRIIGVYDEGTLKLFGALQNSYNYLKKTLFNNILPPVILTLNRNSRSFGYYMPDAWSNESQSTIPEININPIILQLPPIGMMSTLVHEMCHHYHQINGTLGQQGYHNREFAKIMLSIGLVCSDTGKRGGMQTGRRMSHYILEGGRFQTAFYEMPEEYILPFKSYRITRPSSIPTVNRDKIKYQCTECHLTVWGKPNLNIVCGNCNTQLLVPQTIYNQ